MLPIIKKQTLGEHKYEYGKCKAQDRAEINGNCCYNARMNIESIILGFSYIGIFVLMVSNGLFSFPSSQILYILVGYFVGIGYLELLPASLIGAFGNAIGNIFLYEAVRAKGVSVVERFQVLRKSDLKRVEIVFRKKGLWFLFVGKLLPAIKVFIPIPAGLTKVHRGAFALLMLSSSWIWALGFISIGYFFGKGAELWKSYGILLMIIAGLVMYLFYRILYSPSVTKELQEEEVSRKDEVLIP